MRCAGKNRGKQNMKEYELKFHRVEQLEFVNRPRKNGKMELGFEYAYNVGYSENNTCRGEYRIRVFDKQDEKLFHLNMTVTGHFVTAPGTPKETLHLRTYDALYPFVRSIVATFTVNAGIPPIYIPYIDISGKEIYRMEMPRPEA